MDQIWKKKKENSELGGWGGEDEGWIWEELEEEREDAQNTFYGILKELIQILL